MIIYAMSDIHGEQEVFEQNIDNIIKPSLDENQENKLILLGDYLERDINSNSNLNTLYYIKNLQEEYNEQVLVLCGNHELMFLNDVESKYIIFEDEEMINWLHLLPAYYETTEQIYVHAGIDEDAGEAWRYDSKYSLTFKYPHTTGKYEKDIISGHVYTSEITCQHAYHKVYWDNENHFYIDGGTEKSKFIPILKYNTNTKNYSSFELDANGAYNEYKIK